MNRPANNFVLKGTDQSFLQRQKNVFDQLKQPSNNQPVEEMETNRPRNRQRAPIPKLNHLRGKESIFKRPQEPRIFNKSGLKHMPDFKKNPHKWKKYTLADVNDDQMSDKSNTSAALSFLNELKNRKNESEEMETGNDGDSKPEKIYFKKRSSSLRKDEDDDSEANKVSFSNSKLVMPEYVVGQKKMVKKDRKRTDGDSGKKKDALKLDHLFEEEDI